MFIKICLGTFEVERFFSIASLTKSSTVALKVESKVDVGRDFDADVDLDVGRDFETKRDSQDFEKDFENKIDSQGEQAGRLQSWEPTLFLAQLS